MSRLEKMIEEIEYLLFDLDGTLIDTTDLILHAFHETFRIARIPAPDDEVLLSQIGRPLHLQMQDFDCMRAAELYALYQKIYDEYHDEMARSFPGVKEVVEELKFRGYKLGIVTSKRIFTARKELQYFKMENQFEIIIAAEDTHRHKPDPAPLLDAMVKLGASPEQTTYIGDTPYDLGCAHGAGVLAGAVMWGPFAREILEKEKPDYWLESPSSLLKFFPGPPGG
jgi:pyrophosphatase PpaX